MLMMMIDDYKRNLPLGIYPTPFYLCEKKGKKKENTGIWCIIVHEMIMSGSGLSTWKQIANLFFYYTPQWR